MEQKKVLKKLTLNKEEIVNLNDFEMRNLKGGSSQACAVISAVWSLYEITNVIYQSIAQGGEDLSAWNCTPADTDSLNRVWVGEHYVCMLPEVQVNGLNTKK